MVRRAVAAVACLAVVVGLIVGVPASAGADHKLPMTYNFLVSAVAAGRMTDASPPGANDWSCEPSARHPRPVVLVHGTAGNKNTNWQTYAPLLHNNGYCVYAFTYGVRRGTPPVANQLGGMTAMQSSARQMKRFVARVLRSTGADQIDLVGHSQGTLVPAYYAKFLGGRRFIHNYVSLAPVWHGTRLAEFNLLGRVFGVPENEYPGCTACAQFAPDSDFMRKLRKGGLKLTGIRYTNIMTKYDQLVVPYTSGRVKGMRNFVVQDFCDTDYSEHFEIAADPVAARLVLNTLDPRHQRRVPCPVVLPFVGPPV